MIKEKNPPNKGNKNNDNMQIYIHTFNFLLDDYKDIFKHFHSTNTKTGLFLTFLFTTCPLYIQILDINFVRCLMQKYPLFSQIEWSFLCLILFSLLTYLTTFILFMITLIPYQFDKLQTRSDTLKKKSFDYGSLYEADYKTILEDDIRALAFVVSNNSKTVNKKGKTFKIGVYLCFLYNIAIITTFILKSFI